MPLSNALGAFQKQIYADLFATDQYAFGIYYPSSISAHDATAHYGLSQHQGVVPFYPNQTTNVKSFVELRMCSLGAIPKNIKNTLTFLITPIEIA